MNPTNSTSQLVGTSHYAAALPSSLHLPNAPLTLLHRTSSQATTIIHPSSCFSMASFPFDSTPFIPPNHQAIEVEGRPTRIRLLAGASAPGHEEWVITTIVPMPNLLVLFNNIHEVISEFLTHIKHIGFSEINPCPFGQAFVKLDSVFDRDTLLRDNPHPFNGCSCDFSKAQ